MKRLILLIGSTETLEYFSLQMAEYFLAAGREVFLWDMGKPAESIDEFEKIPDKENSVLITFNFIGLGHEGQFLRGGVSIFDMYDIEKICIMVDSPVYYYRFLSRNIPNLRLICIDKNHRRFVEKYYPFYGEAGFMPLAGNLPLQKIWARPGILKKGDITVFETSMPSFDKWKERNCDILFIGNYVPLGSLYPSIKNLSDDYKEFILDIAGDFFKNPSLPLEDVLMERLRSEFPDASDDEYLQACYQMIYIDLYVRNVYRGKLVTAIADAGIKIYCTGKDWEKAPCKKPENIIHTQGSVTSIQCLGALMDSKISLNIMPWFKEGAHDRIFSSMLSGCAVFSDSSGYLDEAITDKKDYFKFDLKGPDETAEALAKMSLEKVYNLENLYEIAAKGFNTALSGHLWKTNAEYVHKLFIK